MQDFVTVDYRGKTMEGVKKGDGRCRTCGRVIVWVGLPGNKWLPYERQEDKKHDCPGRHLSHKKTSTLEQRLLAIEERLEKLEEEIFHKENLIKEMSPKL